MRPVLKPVIKANRLRACGQRAMATACCWATVWRSKQRPPLGAAGARLQEICIAQNPEIYIRLYMQPRSNGTFMLVGSDAAFLAVATACTGALGRGIFWRS